MKTLLTTFLISYSIGVAHASDPSSMFGRDKVLPTLRGGGDDLILTLDNIFGFLIGLLYFISVVVVIYGGFLILVSGGDDDKLKKGKNLVIYAVIGLIVIFLASTLIIWIVDVMGSDAITGSGNP